MKDRNTTISVLDQYMKKLFMDGIRNLDVPGDTMNHSDIRENTDFGKLLHKEGLWSLYKYGDGRSLLYHLCRGYVGMEQSNNPVRPTDSRCLSCDSDAPDEIRGLWTLHNFEWVQTNNGHSMGTNWGT